MAVERLTPLVVSAALSVIALYAAAQEPNSGQPTCGAHATKPCNHTAKSGAIAPAPTAQAKVPHSTTGNPSEAKDGGAAQSVQNTQTAAAPDGNAKPPEAKQPPKPRANAPSTKSEDDHVIEAMDFLMTLDILKNYNLLSDRE